jgi:streptomycin 6-kinase
VDLDLPGLAQLGVDDALIAKRVRLDGQNALDFLAELPALAARWQRRLGLRGARILPGGVLSAVLACQCVEDGTTVVLKLSGAHARSARAEAAALAAWDGIGACALRWSTDEGRVMLLDAIEPGVAVRPGVESADARRAGDLLGLLHRLPTDQIPPAVPSAARELRWRFERAHHMLDGPSHATGLISHDDIDRAHHAALTLHEQSETRVMCHGDFINKNILLDARGDWWAIDPRPCVADPCLDAGFWSLAHRPGQSVKQRCELIARCASLDPKRVWAWAQAFAVSETVLVTDPARAQAHHSVSS